ncbi:acid protease [Clavulina sp. PMI_390]|nr:acid protease [Clavulina sp. PMI_390]
MAGKAPPTAEELRSNLDRRHESIPEHERRMFIPPHLPSHPSTASGNSKDSGNGKRMWIPPKGVPNSGKTSNKQSRQATTTDGFSTVDLKAEEGNLVTQSNVQTANGTTGLDIQANDVGYSATVQVGTPPKNYRIIMDSGSSDFWITAEGCTIQGSTTPCNQQLQTLGSGSSSSFQDTKNPFSVSYGSGFVSGTIITDNVVLAGFPLNAHTMGVATVESTDFGGNRAVTDGLMGLAQQALSQEKTPTPVESLASAGTIQAPITSFKIGRVADGVNDGQITFGGLDTTKFDPTTLITIPNVNTGGFWEGAVDAITVNGTDVGLKGRTAILDSGTTLMLVPPEDAAAIHNLIPGATPDNNGGFVLPCTTTASVALTFGGRSFSIDPRDITFSPLNPNDLTGLCTSGISSGTVGGPTEWLVGDVFLKNAYFSTDESKNTVSLAKLV